MFRLPASLTFWCLHPGPAPLGLFLSREFCRQFSLDALGAPSVPAQGTEVAPVERTRDPCHTKVSTGRGGLTPRGWCRGVSSPLLVSLSLSGFLCFSHPFMIKGKGGRNKRNYTGQELPPETPAQCCPRGRGARSLCRHTAPECPTGQVMRQCLSLIQSHWELLSCGVRVLADVPPSRGRRVQAQCLQRLGPRPPSCGSW